MKSLAHLEKNTQFQKPHPHVWLFSEMATKKNRLDSYSQNPKYLKLSRTTGSFFSLVNLCMSVMIDIWSISTLSTQISLIQLVVQMPSGVLKHKRHQHEILKREEVNNFGSISPVETIAYVVKCYRNEPTLLVISRSCRIHQILASFDFQCL